MNTDERLTKQKRLWLLWLEPALVLLLAPVFLFPSPRRSLLFGFLILLFVLHFIARGRLLEPSPLNGPLALLLLMVLVSLYATFDISLSLPKVAGVLLGAAILIAILNSVSSPRVLGLMFAGFILGGVVLSGIGLLGTQWVGKVPILGGITEHLPPRIRGLQGAEEGFQPNGVAGGLILFVPAQIALLYFAIRSGMKKRRTAAILVSLMITGLVVLLTQSRGGWLGLAAGLLILISWMFRWGRWGAACLLVVVAAVVIRIGPQKAGDRVMSSIGSTSSVAGSIEGRLEVWNRAMYGISDFPFTGMGMNTFRKVVHVLYPLFLTSPDTDIAHCHNQLLQTALDLGIPGLVAYVALLAAAITMGIRVWRHSEEGWIRASAQGLVCGLVAQQVFGITDAIALGAKVGIFFWMALGLLAAMNRITKRNHEDL
jgi:putative inorganic carbon (HCO3(-)) transporter